MELQNPLHVVSSTVDADVLAVLARADSEFTISTLERIIESRSAEGIRKALERLTEQGVVVCRRLGRAHGYSLNREHLAAGAIMSLANLASALRERIRQAVQAWGRPPVYAALFGSAARREMKSDSDIDIVLVRDHAPDAQWQEQIDALARAVTSWTGNDARVLDLATEDVRDRAGVEPVLADIVRDAVTVHGDASEFRRLVGA